MTHEAGHVPVTDRNKLGMWLFLGSEAVFFTLLILAYVFYRSRWVDGDNGPTADILPFGPTVFFSICLFASSATIWLAERSLRRGRHGGMRLWLGITILLGVVFLFGQAREYQNLFEENVTISTGLFGTTFFTLTGFHGLHVLVGLIALAIIWALSGGIRGPHSSALESTSVYWHFVDVVWIAVFSVVYLWGELS